MITGTHTVPGVQPFSYTVNAPAMAIEVLRGMLSRRVPLACDIETFGLGADARRIKVVTFGTPTHAVLLDPRDPAQHRIIRFTIEHARQLVFHNSAFDVPSLAINGLFRAEDCFKVVDTLIWARLAWPSVITKKDLESVAIRLLGGERSVPMKAIFKMLGLTQTDGWRQFDLDRPVYVLGAAKDAIATARILEPVRRAAIATLTTGHPFTDWGVDGAELDALIEREQRINRMLLRRAVKGLRVDLPYLDAYRARTAERLGTAEAELTDLGIRPGNAGDLIKFLEEQGALPDDHPRTAKTQRASTAEKHLLALAHPVAQSFVTAKSIAKIDKDYLAKAVDVSITKADGSDWIYPSTNLLAATTGRASMSGVPLHQFPGPARGVVLADLGDSMTSLDWSQIEPVLVANIAGDLPILAGYEDGSSDVYTALGERAGIARKPAKTTLLAQLYGEGMAKLAYDLGCSVQDAYELRDWLFKAMPATARLIGRLRAIGREHRKVFTLSGRILDVPMGTYDGEVSVQTHKAVNYFVQGGAYDMLAETLVKIDDAGLGDALYLTMHDEIVCSTDAAHDIRKIMEQPPARLIELAKRTPVIRTDMALLGERWSDA